MIRSRFTVSIFILFSFFAYYLYRCNAVTIEMGSDKDDGSYTPLMVQQHFHRSSNFFNCKRHHGCCERTASSDQKMIGAQIFSIRDRMLRADLFTSFTRRDIDLPPNIIPPLPKTGCENLEGDAKKSCEVDVQR
jgi:hypothetical protein